MRLGPITVVSRPGKVAGDNPLTVFRGVPRAVLLHSIYFSSVTDATVAQRKWAIRITVGITVWELVGGITQGASTTRAVYYINVPVSVTAGAQICNAMPPVLVPEGALVTVEPSENNQGADVTSNPIAMYQEVLEW